MIEFIAKSLVNDPTEVRVEEQDRREHVIIELSVAKEDMGRVIGRHGRIANAMRSLLRASASREDKRASLDII